MPALTSMNDLLVDKLRDLLNAENQLLDALPRMVEAASTPALREAIEEHHRLTESHVARLQDALGLLNAPVRDKACKGMEGLLEEGRELLQKDGEEHVKDAGLIAAAQAVEHYEIAGYGTALAYAELLHRQDAVGLLQATLEEEKAADQKLSEIAEREVNPAAAKATAEI